MALKEGVIPTLFQGVSRQPDSVRFPGQVEDAENVDFSVETGGFSPRLGLRLKKKITGLTPGAARRLHLINRDASEKYRMVLSSGGIRIFDANYVEKTVNVDAGGATWLTSDPANFSVLTALDYTFMAKKTDTVAMSGTVAAAAPSDAVIWCSVQGPGNGGINLFIFINGIQVVATGAEQDTSAMATDIVSKLTTSLGAGWTINSRGSFVFIRKDDGASFTIRQKSPIGGTLLSLWHDTITEPSAAPAQARNGMMLHVKGIENDTAGFWIKFTADDGQYGTGIWHETVAPGDQIAFDATTMPRALIRNGDGSFTLQTNTWAQKTAGNQTDVPPPDFVGDKVNDIVFTKNRLGFLSGETMFVSEAGEVFNFWPKSMMQLTDADPFGLTNTTNAVSKLYYGIPFRRSVFLLADNAQFEASGTPFTAARSAMDLATSYAATPNCRPIAIGDELYFVAEVGTIATLLSYVYDQNAVSETANDVSKHATGFLPSGVVEITGDPIQGQIFLRSTSTPDSIYVHTFFYQGVDRVQSAWGRHKFTGATVLSFGVLDGVLNALIEYDGAVWLAELPLKSDIYSDFAWVPRLDFNQLLTGTYNAGTNRTTWTLGYTPTSPAAITSSLFPTNKRMIDLPLTIAGQTVYATGDYSAHPVMVGEKYTSYVDLSKQYARDRYRAVMISGRLTLSAMRVSYSNSAYFKAVITTDDGRTKTKVFNARQLGDSDNTVQTIPVKATGRFRFGVNSNSEKVTIRITSDKPYPYTIVSGHWFGDFSQLAA